MREQFLLGFISGYCLAAFVNVSIVAVLALKVLRVAHAAALQAERLAGLGTGFCQEPRGSPPLERAEHPQMGTAEILRPAPGVPKSKEA